MYLHKSKGVTLIELMITIAIIAIAAAVAYPSYKGYTTVTNRSEAKIAINQIAMAQERFFGDRNTYTIALSQLAGYTADTVRTERGYYDITAVAGPSGIAASFTLTATPVVGTPQDSDSCTSLTLTSVGVKGGAPTKDDCW